jgi:PAS domain S-box-containing protein
MSRNVTEQVELVNLLAAIVDCSDDAIISKNLDGTVTSWNKSAERIFGYAPEEAIGQHIHLIIPPERHPEEATILDRLRRGDRVDHFHTVRRRKDGSLIDVSLTISPVRDSSGRVVGASKVARDITEQKRAELALRESEQRFRVVTDASPILVWMASPDKLCYYFNKGWLDFVGRTIEQESGNGWAQNVHPDDFDRCLQIYVSNFDARRSFEMEYRMRHHTGQYRWILDRGVPRHTPDGTFEGYIGACLDIHNQKEAAEKVRIADDMTRLMKAQDDERRHIARELHDSAGQTLAVLGMNLSRLVRRTEGLAPDLAKDGKEIETIVQQLQREIRTASYLLHPPLLDENGLASALSCYVEGLTDRSNIAIALEIADNVGRLPNDMELALFRFVQECLTNIHRHSESKTALIRITRQEEGIRAEVQDQGRGIPPDRLAEIQSRGSGVGLRGIRERIRPFDGKMKIESSASGTSVIVLVQRAQEEPAPKATPRRDVPA